MQWHTQAGNITTNIKVEVEFTLPEISATNVVTWIFHVDKYTKGEYNMILGRYLLTESGINLKLFDHVIKFDEGTFKGLTAPTVDYGVYSFNDLNTGKITPE